MRPTSTVSTGVFKEGIVVRFCSIASDNLSGTHDCSVAFATQSRSCRRDVVVVVAHEEVSRLARFSCGGVLRKMVVKLCEISSTVGFSRTLSQVFFDVMVYFKNTTGR